MRSISIDSDSSSDPLEPNKIKQRYERAVQKKIALERKKKEKEKEKEQPGKMIAEVK